MKSFIRLICAVGGKNMTDLRSFAERKHEEDIILDNEHEYVARGLRHLVAADYDTEDNDYLSSEDYDEDLAEAITELHKVKHLSD